MIVLPRMASDEAIKLCLIKHANPVVKYRLVCMLNKALKTLSKDNKSGLSDWAGCVC
jgi:hypothetical protein